MSKQKVLAAAIAEIGYTEGVNNDNKFAAKVGHANHQPWCATFLMACLKAGDEADACINTASVVEIWEWAKKNNALITVQAAQQYDFVLCAWNGSKIPQHIEYAAGAYNIVTNSVATIGGNTGTKSQANGEGVFKKVRAKSEIFAVVRPKYKATDTEKK